MNEYYMNITLSTVTFYCINFPLFVFNIIANIFFAFCIISPRSAGLKQPVKMLLGSLLCCSTFYLVFLVGITCVLYTNSSYEFYIATYLLVVFTVSTSLSTSAWLNFFYFTQIVPFKRTIFLWMKRNIKSIIYGALVFDRILFLLDLTVHLAIILDFYNYMTLREFNGNLTHINGTTYKNGTGYSKFFFVKVTESLTMMYTFLCLCVMLVSSFTTVCYLYKHIRSMSVSSSHSSPRLYSQMRVAITGLLQGVLFFFCDTWVCLSFFVNYYTDGFLDNNIMYTIVSLYMTGTNINLGVGQTLFRRTAADIWLKATRAMKRLKMCE